MGKRGGQAESVFRRANTAKLGRREKGKMNTFGKKLTFGHIPGSPYRLLSFQ
jgi:hypothetical protein